MMAEEGMQVVQIRDDFYRDSFGKFIFIMANIGLAILVVLMTAIYLHYQKPLPIVFPVDNDFRIQSEVPLNQPYLQTTDVLQWVGNILPKVFMLDFYEYNDQVKTFNQYFTDNGWKVYLNQLNNYANYTTLQTDKLFLTAEPVGAPYVLNEGLFKEGVLYGKYGWWIQMPIKITYIAPERTYTDTLTLQVLVIRVSTLNNLSGIAIENIIVANKD